MYPQFVWLAFVIVQALDGGLSYIGVVTMGTWIEANPLVAWYVDMLGPAAGLSGAKLQAVACGIVLYLLARHTALALLTLLYLVCAIVPWAHVLRG